MPFYRFLLHGRDSTLPEEVRGFYTTRHTWAPNEQEAAGKVLRRISREFITGRSARIWGGMPPLLEIEDVWRIALHQLWAAPNRGSTFYDSRNDAPSEG
jgi:hypothetical protein